MTKASPGDEECWLIGGAEEEKLVSICHFLDLDTPYRVRVGGVVILKNENLASQ